jgi:ankyrin repeat protein
MGKIIPIAERTLLGEPQRRDRGQAPAARLSRLVSSRLLARRPVSLHISAADGEISRLRETLDRGVPIDSRDAFSGRTALHVATIARQHTIAALLLGRGADFDAKSNLGKTALHFAASSTSDGCEPDTALMRLLLEQGARVDSPTFDRGRTALHESVATGMTEGVTLVSSGDIMLEPSDTFDDRLHADDTDMNSSVAGLPSDEGPHFAAAALLLSYGADVNARDERGWTALHHVTTLYAPDNSRELVGLLLLHGADPHLRTLDGRQTALDHARSSRLGDLVTLLEGTA